MYFMHIEMMEKFSRKGLLLLVLWTLKRKYVDSCVKKFSYLLRPGSKLLHSFGYGRWKTVLKKKIGEVLVCVKKEMLFLVEYTDDVGLTGIKSKEYWGCSFRGTL